MVNQCAMPFFLLITVYISPILSNAAGNRVVCAIYNNRSHAYCVNIFSIVLISNAGMVCSYVVYLFSACM